MHERAYTVTDLSMQT